MELEKAKVIADDILTQLRPYCDKIAVVGSIRRKKSWERDIDIVCIPDNQGQFVYALQTLGRIKVGGQKLIRCELQGISLDVYIATPETWSTLLLIRTGSAAHNIKLCTLAKRNGMKLHADGSGLFKIEAQGCEGIEVRIAGDTETSIFEALGLPYVAPERRN